MFKGNFLLFFLPGIIVTIAYLIQKLTALNIQDSVQLNECGAWYGFIKDWFNSGVRLFFSVFHFFLDQIYIFIILTALSPFNTRLGEKLDEELTGNITESSFIRFISDVIRMVFVVLIALILQLLIVGFYSLIVYTFGLPELVNTVIHFMIQAFFFGFTFYDFCLERNKRGVFYTLGFSFSRPLAMVITGSIFLGIYAIPYVGIILAPVLCLMISTVAYLYYTQALPTINNLQSNE